MRVLLLEPDRLLARQYTDYLSSKGHTVVAREDAQGGINAADNLNPDIVVVELLLAGHSGVEFLYEFRSYTDWQKVPAIILSTVTRDATGVPDSTFDELGVSSFLYKPDTSLEQLEKTLTQAVTNKLK